MSSLAQEEPRSISENVLWGVRKRFEDGKVYIPYSTFLGYDRGEDGNPVINPTEAETVRYIFSRFLEGKTPYAISLELMERGDKTGTGRTRWDSETVIRILMNENIQGTPFYRKRIRRICYLREEQTTVKFRSTL